MAVFSYTYDTLGRQTESSLRLNGVQDRTINIEYDYLGRALSAELTGNAINDILAEFDYNAVGALTNINRYEWNDNDDLYELIAKSNIQYNAKNQITNITHVDAADSIIASHSYLFSPDGNITQYTNSIDGTVNYTNDFLGQLIGADYSNTSIHNELYQYDLNGNRELVTNANGDLVVYSTGLNNELNSDGNYSYTYDAEGNRISKTNAAGTERELYSWDYRNRLSSVTKQEYNATTQEWETVQIVEYAYDYNNVLIRKVLDANGDGVSDSKTLFLPEKYQTAIQLDDSDLSDQTPIAVSHRYLWTPQNLDKLLADIQVSPTGSEILWTLTDHLGTIRDVIQQTSSGIIQKAHIIYDAYGNVLSCKDANGTDIESPILFGFTGKYFDADTQLQNNVNRWYDSTTGRWVSTDPIGFEGNDTNLYRYVQNNILDYCDNFGLVEIIKKLPILRIVVKESDQKGNIVKTEVMTLQNISFYYDSELCNIKGFTEYISSTRKAISYAVRALHYTLKQFDENPQKIKCCIEKIYKSNDMSTDYKFNEIKKRIKRMLDELPTEKLDFHLNINETNGLACAVTSCNMGDPYKRRSSTITLYRLFFMSKVTEFSKQSILIQYKNIKQHNTIKLNPQFMTIIHEMHHHFFGSFFDSYDESYDYDSYYTDQYSHLQSHQLITRSNKNLLEKADISDIPFMTLIKHTDSFAAFINCVYNKFNK